MLRRVPWTVRRDAVANRFLSRVACQLHSLRSVGLRRRLCKSIQRTSKSSEPLPRALTLYYGKRNRPSNDLSFGQIRDASNWIGLTLFAVSDSSLAVASTKSLCQTVSLPVSPIEQIQSRHQFTSSEHFAAIEATSAQVNLSQSALCFCSIWHCLCELRLRLSTNKTGRRAFVDNAIQCNQVEERSH